MNVKFHKNCENTGKFLKISCVRCNFVKWHFFSWHPIRNFLWCYYRWLITSLALEKWKKECSKLFWYKVLVDWNFKFLSFLVDSVLKLFSWCTANIWVRLNKIWPKGKNFSGLIWKKKIRTLLHFPDFFQVWKIAGQISRLFEPCTSISTGECFPFH